MHGPRVGSGWWLDGHMIRSPARLFAFLAMLFLFRSGCLRVFGVRGA